MTPGALARILFVLIAVAVPVPAHRDASADGEVTALKVDPFLLAAAEEVWQIVAGPDNPLWPGWDAADTPILLYFPGVQDVLIDHPDPPGGFVPYRGPLSFSGGAIMLRDGPTLIDWDGQNTSQDVNGLRTLVVADTLSNRRQWLRGVLGDPRAPEEKLADIRYDDLLSDPYHQLGMIAHEAFHVFQDRAAPDGRVERLLLQTAGSAADTGRPGAQAVPVSADPGRRDGVVRAGRGRHRREPAHRAARGQPPSRTRRGGDERQDDPGPLPSRGAVIAVLSGSHLGRIQGLAQTQMMTVLAFAIGPLLPAGTLARTGASASIFHAAAVTVMGIVCWYVVFPDRARTVPAASVAR